MCNNVRVVIFVHRPMFEFFLATKLSQSVLVGFNTLMMTYISSLVLISFINPPRNLNHSHL